MVKKVAIVTTGHPPMDERIFWKFGLSLSDNNFEVEIICSTDKIQIHRDGIFISGFDGSKLEKRLKIMKLYDMLKVFSPDAIICSEPLAVFSAHKFKKKAGKKVFIILDVTEWYPENVAFKYSGFNRYFLYTSLFLLNVVASNFADNIIIGEISKKKRYDIIAPGKPKTIIGYYPVLKYFKYSTPKYNGKTLTLCYAGLLNFDRGLLTLLDIALLLAQRQPQLEIKVKIIGKFPNESDEKIFDEIIKKDSSIFVERSNWVDYDKISAELEDTDICFDLRKKSFIYNNSLPIKIFEYMACGKPFIFTKIKPLEKELNIMESGFLVDPENQSEIISKIENYLSDPDLFKKHSEVGRHIIESEKNWEKESKKLIRMIKLLS